jgi:hypothetical protein
MELFIQVFNYFNLCEIVRNFHWSTSLIRGTRPKKVENISTFLFGQQHRRINRNQTFLLMAHVRILFFSDPVLNAAYFPEWKLALTRVSSLFFKYR